MASSLAQVADCCDECECNVVSVTLPCTPAEGDGMLTVSNTSALRLVLANQRSTNMGVRVLTHEGTELDGSGYESIWRPNDLTPDGGILSVRPADILDDATPGRFRQWL